MDDCNAIFLLSAQGRQARSSASRLPQCYQALLQAIEGVTTFDAIAACLPLESEARIAAYLEDLEAIGLIESVTLDWLAELHLVEQALVVRGNQAASGLIELRWAKT